MCPSPASPYVSSHSLLQGKADLVLIKFCSKVALSPLLCIAWMAPRCGIIDANNVTIIAHKFPFFKVLKDGYRLFRIYAPLFHCSPRVFPARLREDLV